MTNELEKQFFDTFGIEPKYESHACDGWGRTVEVKYFTDKKEADKFGMVLSEPKYPTITDRHLLELVCILSKYQKDRGSLLEINEISLNEVKEEILEMLIYRVDGCKHQVRALFKEG